MDRDLATEKVSFVLNGERFGYKPYILIGEKLGIEINPDSEIFHEIEEFIVEKYEQMEEEEQEKQTIY